MRAIARVLWPALVLLAFLLLVQALGGCKSCPTCYRPVTPAPLPEVTVVTETVACASLAPPKAPAFAVAGPARGCPAPWASCLLRDDAATLRTYLADLETWAATTWSRCAAKPPPTEDP